MLVSLEVGKVDAGVAVLLTEDKRLIEFPSILLPPDITSGSIVDVNVSRNLGAEARAQKSFQALQSQILSTFGTKSPSAPVLRCRNATQTSVVLEWDSIFLATASLRSLSLYRNGTKAGSIPRPKEMTSTKISGLAVDTEYVFSLLLRTSAGTYGSEKLSVRTHKMTDLSGITITPGVMEPQLRDSLVVTVDKIGAKIIDQIRIDTTHFVCTEARGQAWEKAKEMNIPIVSPDWVRGCERDGRLVSVRGYYLNVDPRLRQIGPGASSNAQTGSDEAVQQRPTTKRQESQQSMKEPATPRTEVTPPTPERDNGMAAVAASNTSQVQKANDSASEIAMRLPGRERANAKVSDDEGEDEGEGEGDGDENNASESASREEGETSEEDESVVKDGATAAKVLPDEGDTSNVDNFDDVAI